MLTTRRREADEFYAALQTDIPDEEDRLIQRQALAGMLWSKQFYYFDIPQWLDGDNSQPRPPEQRRTGRNIDWLHLNNADIIAMPGLSLCRTKRLLRRALDEAEFLSCFSVFANWNKLAALDGSPPGYHDRTISAAVVTRCRSLSSRDGGSTRFNSRECFQTVLWLRRRLPAFEHWLHVAVRRVLVKI